MSNLVPNKKTALMSALPNINAEDYFSDEELETIRQRIESPNYRLREERATYFLLFKVLLRTGVRISEALRLTPYDFKRAINVVQVQTLKQKKNKPPREIPIHADLKETYQDYLITFKIDPDSHDPIFPMSRQAVDQFLKSLQDEQLKIHAHKFRHTFAVKAITAGTPLNVVQEWLGHSSILTTNVYTKVTAKHTQHYMELVY